MTLIELSSSSAVDELITKNRNVVITFSAHWCGPCKASKPALEELAIKYSNDITKDVKIGIVYENDFHNQYNVRAFPTYVLYQNNGKEMNRVEGANIPGVEQMIENAAGIQRSYTGGETLGGGNSKPVSVEEARLARLARLGGGGTTSSISPAATETATAPDGQPTPQKDEMEVVKELSKSQDEMKGGDADAMEIDTEQGEEQVCKPVELVDPTIGLNQEHIQALTNEMGFALLRAQKGLLYGNGNTVEGAIEWLTDHQDDVDIDEPIKPRPVVQIAQSYKCNECGKILSNMANLELHANKTGHSDFEESTEHVTPLSAEEKAIKIKEIKELLKVKRAEREDIEEKDKIDREKQRRFMGKEMLKTKEQLDIEQRKRETYLRKKEKDDFNKERLRLRHQLALDKAERLAQGGKLTSKLSVDGYKPDMLQYNESTDNYAVGDTASLPSESSSNDNMKPVSKKMKADSTKMQDYIKKVSSYKAGGDGGKCLKILKIYVSNVIDNPNDNKYKTIKMDNNAFKLKVRPFIGAKQLLLAIGFQQIDENTLSITDETLNIQILTETRIKLEAAIIAYG